MIQQLFIATLLFVAKSNGQDVSEPKTVIGDPQSDAFIDEVLKNLRQMIIDNGWDPMDLPDLETGFSDTILGITWHGDAWLRNGLLWGLSTIERSGSTSFTVDQNTSMLELTAMLSLNRPSGKYDAHADFMGIGVNADVTLDIHDVKIYLDATAQLTENGLAQGDLKVKNFYIDHLGSINVDISGLGPLDWILEILVDLVDTFFRDWIKDLVEGPLRDLIQSLFDEIHFEIPASYYIEKI